MDDILPTKQAAAFIRKPIAKIKEHNTRCDGKEWQERKRMKAVAKFPTLNDLAAQPELCQGVSPDVGQRLYWQCLSVLNALTVPLIANGRKSPPSKSATDTLLDAKEVAERVNRSVSSRSLLV